MKKILVIGSSGHAKVIIDTIELQKKYEIAGLIDTFQNKTHFINNYKVLGTEKDISKLIQEHNIHGCIIAIGDNFTRMCLSKEILLHNKKIKFVTVIHPSAIIGKNVKIGIGSAIIAGVIINSDAEIGKHCIINTNSSVGHDAKIENFSSIAPGVTIGGEVCVNTCSAISLGANILESVKIGKHSVIGAGSLVNKNIGDYKVAYGSPIKEIKNRKKNDKYLGMNSSEKVNDYSLELYNISNQQDEEKYNSFLDGFPNANVFNSLQYYNHYYDIDLRYFVLNKNGKAIILMAIIFNKINSPALDDNEFYDVSSPYGYSGPLFNNTTDQDIMIFWSKVDKWYKKNNVITEFIRFNLEYNYSHYSGHLIPSLSNIVGVISDFDTLWGNFKQKVRNNYRKAEKNQLTCVIYLGKIPQEIIDSFYNIYIKTMKRKTAITDYFYPKYYFENIINCNLNKIIIAIVYKNKTPISTEFIIIKKVAIYSYLGGTLSEFFDLRPNDFLKIEVIKWAIKNNKGYYVLGGGRKDFDSLYQYKKAYFPKDNDMVFYTGRKIINKKIYYELLKNIEVEYSDANKLIHNSTKYFPLYKDINYNAEINGLHIITSKKEWQDVLNIVENYDFYHTYDYHNLSKTKDEKGLLIKYTEDDMVIALPLIIRKINNSNYYDATSVYGYAGPLQSNVNCSFHNSNFIVALERFFKEEKIVSVFSRLNPFINHQKMLLNGFGRIKSLGNVVNIDLTKKIEEQRTIFSKTTKRYLNKCRRICDFKISNETKDINTFIDLYYENMDRVNAEKKYYFSKEYFFNFINSNEYKTEVCFVTHKEDETIIAAAMMVKTNNIIQYHISGTKENFLNLSPMRLIIDEMRIRGSQENYSYFNLGGGLGNNEDELFRFKSSFSKDFKPFHIWQYIALPDIYDKLTEEIEFSEGVDFFPLYRYKK